jgi:hypothetical protein
MNSKGGVEEVTALAYSRLLDWEAIHAASNHAESCVNEVQISCHGGE